MPLLVQPAAATEWSPGDAWDLGTTNVPVGGRPFSGQVHLQSSSGLQEPSRFYAFVDAGGSLEVRLIAAPWGTTVANEGGVVVRVISPQGQVFETEQDFQGLAGSQHGFNAAVELVLGVDESMTSDIAGVWTVEFSPSVDTGEIVGLRWDIVPRDADGTAHQGRVWTYNYRRTQHMVHVNPYAGDSATFLGDGPGTAANRWVWDQSAWIWSDTGLMVRVDDMGYNGLGSSLWATSHGLVDEDCQPLRRSRSMGGDWPGTSIIDAQNCGLPFYRVFFEHPDVSMPASAQFFDDATGQIVPNHPLTFELNMPSVDSISFTQVGTGSTFLGLIHVGMGGQPTTVRVELDADGDGSFDGPSDRVLFEAITLRPGTNLLPWLGQDGNGVLVPLEQTIGIRVTPLSSFETHIVANDVERRLGGIRMTALNGPLAGSDETRYLVNWDDNDPSFFDADGGFLCWNNGLVPVPCRDTDLFPESVIGTRVDSRHGVHAWGGFPTEDAENTHASWGDGRDIVTWQVAELDAESVMVTIEGTGVDITIGDDLIIGDDEDFFCPVLEGGLLPVVVTNHGPLAATGVRVSLPAGVTLAPDQDEVSFTAGHTHPVLIGDLAVGQSVTFYVHTPLDDNCEWNVPVQVVIDQLNTLPEHRRNDVSVGEVPAPEVDLGIDIEVPVDEDDNLVLPVCPPAGEIELRVTVTNHGPQDGHEVVVTLPAGTVLAPGQDHVSANTAGDLVLVGDLPVGDQVVFYVVSPLSEDCAWDVTVRVDGLGDDPNQDNNEDTTTGTTDGPPADLEIEIDVPVDEDGNLVLPVCPPAGDIELLVTVTNHGPYLGTDVTVTLPAGTVLAPGQDHVTVNSAGDLVFLGDLEVDEYVTFYVISPLSEECSWDVTVSVEGRGYDPNLDNNEDTTTGITDGPPADLEIDIEVPVDEDGNLVLPVCPPAGDIELLVTVTNHGPYIGTDVTVTLPAGTVLAPGQDHVTVNEGGYLVLLGDIEVDEQVTFYVISPLSEDCAWDVTVSVEGRGYDPNLDNNEDTTTGITDGPPADLDIDIDVPVDEDGNLVLPVCPPAGDIELLVTVTNHGPYIGTDVTVTLPAGTVLAPGQDHVTVNDGGYLVFLGDIELDGQVTFYVISPLSEECSWDVTVSVEGRGYDPNLDNNEDNHSGSPDTFPGLGGGEETPGTGNNGTGGGTDGDGPAGGGNVGGGQDTPGTGGTGTGTPGGPGAPGGSAGGPGAGGGGAGSGVGTGVRAPGRLPLTGASGIWIAGAGLAVVGGLLLALNARKTKAATTAAE